MTNFSLTIELGNDAMQHPGDVAWALDSVARKLNREGFEADSRSIMDTNGNTVGTWHLEPSDLPAFVPRTLSLAEVRDGTGFAPGTRFIPTTDCTVDCAEYGCAGPGGWTHGDARGQS